MDISVVIPAFNEGKNVLTLATEIEKARGDEDSIELVFVDDGSTDDTMVWMLKSKQSVSLPCVILQFASNQGQSSAISTGVREASSPWVLTIDADLQNNPKNITMLVDQLRDKQDVSESVLVAGIRQRRQDSYIKKISSKVANSIRGRLLGDNCADTGCALKLFNRKFFLSLPQFNHMHRFLPALYQMYGGRCIYVSVDHRPRVEGKSKYGTIDRLMAGLWDLTGVLWLKMRIISGVTYTRTE